MKSQVYFGIAFRIILLFGAGFLMSYVNPMLFEFFGDKPCAKPDGCGGAWGDRSIDWGAAHYWYAWALFLLFVLSLVNAIVGVVNLLNKHYKL